MYVFQGQNADWPQISYLIFTVPDLQWVQNFKELRQTKNLCLLNFRKVGLLDPILLFTCRVRILTLDLDSPFFFCFPICSEKNKLGSLL